MYYLIGGYRHCQRKVEQYERERDKLIKRLAEVEDLLIKYRASSKQLVFDIQISEDRRMRNTQGLDTIDREAERIFGKIRQGKRVSMRRGLQRVDDARRFNELFRRTGK